MWGLNGMQWIPLTEQKPGTDRGLLCASVYYTWQVLLLNLSYTHHTPSPPPVPPFPEVTCTPVWSSGQNATAATRSRHRTPPRANATWSVKERRATCAGEPTGCPSTGWSWARSQHAAVSLTPLQQQLQRQNPSRVLKENACWDYQMRPIFSPATFVWFWVNAAAASRLRCSVYPPPKRAELPT